MRTPQSKVTLFIGLSVVLAVAILGQYLFRSSSFSPPAPQSQSETPSSPSSEVDSTQEQAPARSALSTPLPTSSPPTDVRLSEITPAVENLREEVQKNPHQTPPSLIRFSRELGKKVEQAKQSQRKREMLFGELRQCVLDPRGAQSTQALCLIQSKELSKMDPDLKAPFERLWEQAPQTVQTIASFHMN